MAHIRNGPLYANGLCVGLCPHKAHNAMATYATGLHAHWTFGPAPCGLCPHCIGPYGQLCWPVVQTAYGPSVHTAYGVGLVAHTSCSMYGCVYTACIGPHTWPIGYGYIRSLAAINHKPPLKIKYIFLFIFKGCAYGTLRVLMSHVRLACASLY